MAIGLKNVAIEFVAEGLCKHTLPTWLATRLALLGLVEAALLLPILLPTAPSPPLLLLLLLFDMRNIGSIFFYLSLSWWQIRFQRP